MMMEEMALSLPDWLSRMTISNGLTSEMMLMNMDTTHKTVINRRARYTRRSPMDLTHKVNQSTR